MKNVLNSRVAKSLLVGTVMPLISVMVFPRSRPVVAGSSTMTAPNMYGWMLHVKTYSPGVVNVTSSPPLRGSVVNGMFAAPEGNSRLDRVWTVFELPENFTRTPGVATASERVPAIVTPVSNQRPGLSVIEKFTSLPPSARTTPDAASATSPMAPKHARIHFLLFTRAVISHPPCLKARLSAWGRLSRFQGSAGAIAASSTGRGDAHMPCRAARPAAAARAGLSRGPSLANDVMRQDAEFHVRYDDGTPSLPAGIEIAHDDAEHLSRHSGLALGDLHAGAELAGLVGQIVVGARFGGQSGASAADD